MIKFTIWAEIKCDDFEADSQEEAEYLFWESIKDSYGIRSCTQLHICRVSPYQGDKLLDIWDSTGTTKIGDFTQTKQWRWSQ